MRRPINKPGWRTSYSHWITAMKMRMRSCPPLSISPASTHQTLNQTLVKSQSKLIRKRSVLIVAYCALPRHENLEVFTMLESFDVLAWGLQWSCALTSLSHSLCQWCDSANATYAPHTMVWSPQTTHLIELLTMPKTRNGSILILSTDSRDINVNSIYCHLTVCYFQFSDILCTWMMTILS